MPLSSDLAKLIQVAAYGYANGESDAAITARLLEYVSDADPNDLRQALAYGKLASVAGSQLTRGLGPLADIAIGSAEAPGSTGYRALARVRTGPGDNDFRMVVATAPAGATGQQIRAAVDAEIDRLGNQNPGSDVQPGFGQNEILYVSSV